MPDVSFAAMVSKFDKPAQRLQELAEARLQHEGNEAVIRRLDVMDCAVNGVPWSEIPEFMEISERTFWTWLAWYRKGGIARLVKTGRGHRVRPEGARWEAIAARLRETMGKPAADARVWLRAEFGLKVTLQTVYNWRREAGKAPAPVLETVEDFG